MGSISGEGVGDVLGTTFGPYRIEELLGRGGMGEVYRAHDVERGRDVALKVLPTHLASDTEYQERFKRECRAAARLNEPHIVPIHTFGEIDGRLFLDMRLVAGMDLASWLKAHGAMPPEAAVSVVSQIAAALDAAHAAGLVHRDVKPSNVLLAGVSGPQVDREVFAYLFDFGIARAQEGMGDDPALTRAGTMPGSLAYVAPERFSGVEGDPRADVYALACVLHQALTGRPPYEGDLATLMRAHLSAPPPRPTTSRPELPAGLDQIVAQGMAKDPAARPATAGALAAAARAELGIRTNNEADPWRATVAPPSATAVIPPGWTSAPQQPAYGQQTYGQQTYGQQAYAPQGAYGQPQPGYAPTAVGGYAPPPAGWTSHPSHPSYPNNPGHPPSAPPQKPSGGKGPLIAIAALLVLALVGGGITWAVLAGNGGGEGGDVALPPVTTPPSSAPLTAPVTTTPPTSEPAAPATDETERLLADLPAGFGPDICSPDTIEGSQAIATVNCPSPPTTGTGVSDALFARYADVPSLDADFEIYASTSGTVASTQIDDCASGDPVRIVYNRGEVSDLGGQVACFVENGVAYLVWTDDAAVALGYLSNADGDVAALYEWWKTNDFTAVR
jgi:serine/threonine kinase PknH